MPGAGGGKPQTFFMVITMTTPYGKFINFPHKVDAVTSNEAREDVEKQFKHATDHGYSLMITDPAPNS